MLLQLALKTVFTMSIEGAVEGSVSQLAYQQLVENYDASLSCNWNIYLHLRNFLLLIHLLGTVNEKYRPYVISPVGEVVIKKRFFEGVFNKHHMIIGYKEHCTSVSDGNHEILDPEFHTVHCCYCYKHWKDQESKIVNSTNYICYFHNKHKNLSVNAEQVKTALAHVKAPNPWKRQRLSFLQNRFFRATETVGVRQPDEEFLKERF